MPLFGSAVVLAPMVADWTLQTFAAVESTNFRRILTGFVGSAALCV
jgi:uncharacterized membrane protein